MRDAIKHFNLKIFNNKATEGKWTKTNSNNIDKTNEEQQINKYRNSQIELKRRVEHLITKNTEKKNKNNSTRRSQFKALLEHCEANEKKQQ